MDVPPPVPPKELGYTPHMDEDRPSTALTSGSKRKRQSTTKASFNGVRSDIEAVDHDEGTPNKRSRPHVHQSDVSASEDNESAQPRSIRRKKGSRNLSNMNLRHAAKLQTPSQATLRGSKFQEGSLTDKPSNQPPSFFTRFARFSSMDVQNVDALMSDYHSDAPTPPDSVERGPTTTVPTTIGNASTAPKSEQSKSWFHFGRNFASNFHPVALWKTVWNESKEELIKEKAEEEQRKARLKAEAEAAYAGMKRDGRFSFQVVDKKSNDLEPFPEFSQAASEEFESIESSVDQSRNTSAATVLHNPRNDAMDVSATPVPESASKIFNGLKDRLHLKKPSLTNLKSDLRRMRSDFSLSTTRETSSSASPAKADPDHSILRKAASRVDLRKHQRLSKRVSDLENKLQQARDELDLALNDASPMPKLTGRFEKFTPSGVIKRSKFVPGKLPSLPSERILMAQQLAKVNGVGELEVKEMDEPRKGMDLSLHDFLAEQKREEGEDEETIKPSRARQYPPRASSLFDLDDSNAENHTPPGQKSDQPTAETSPQDSLTSLPTNMDPNSVNIETGEVPNESADQMDYAALDAKLKALDANVKTASKAKQAKKRKMGEKDTVFKPTRAESDEDGDWEKVTTRKKRKSTGKTNADSPRARKHGGGIAAANSSPRSKKSTAARGSAAGMVDSSPLQQDSTKDMAVGLEAPDTMQPTEPSTATEKGVTNPLKEVEAEDPDLNRASIDSQAAILDPVYEEEEDAAPAGTKRQGLAPTQAQVSAPAPTKSATVNYSRRTPSPGKRTGTNGTAIQPSVEEQIFTRAALAAQLHSGRHHHQQAGPPSRSASPVPTNNKTIVVTVTDENETVTVFPGADGVPPLPGTTTATTTTMAMAADPGAREGGVKNGNGEFVWPDDVF